MCVSIIIVNYNTKELLHNCLISIYEQTKDIEFEVIVSDNGSVDGAIQMVQLEFPNVIIIKNNMNIGFGAANNKGLDIARGKYVFYLNSDTVLLNNAVKIFYDFWENYSEKDELGAIGCNLLDGNFETTHSAGSFPCLGGEIKKY
jgi:GT2 family glycosyltransferase